MIKALKRLFGILEVPKIPEMQFPKDYPEFDEMWHEIMRLDNDFNEANPLHFLEGTAKVYMGLNQYKIYSDWFYGYVCFYSYKPELKDMCILPIERVIDKDCLRVGL